MIFGTSSYKIRMVSTINLQLFFTIKYLVLVLEKLDSVNSKVTMLDKNVDILKTMSGPSTGGGPDMSSIMNTLNDMNKKAQEDLA